MTDAKKVLIVGASRGIGLGDESATGIIDQIDAYRGKGGHHFVEQCENPQYNLPTHSPTEHIRRIAMLTREVFLISLVLSDRHGSSVTGIVLR